MFYGGADNRFTSTASFTLNEFFFFEFYNIIHLKKIKIPIGKE